MEAEGEKEAHSQGRASVQGPPLILSVAAVLPVFSQSVEQVRGGHMSLMRRWIIPLCEGSGQAGPSEGVLASAEEGGVLCTAVYINLTGLV